MRIRAEGIGRSFREHVLFRNLSFIAEPGNPLSIEGNNGSGKSTLISMMMGASPFLQGTITWEKDNKKIEPEHWFRMLSYSSPFLDLPGHLKVHELLDWYFSFKPKPKVQSLNNLLVDEVKWFPTRVLIERYSTGMKQRLKNLIAITAGVPVLFLDEPCSNLDKQNMLLYQHWIELIKSDKTIIVATNNRKDEAQFCTHQIILGA